MPVLSSDREKRLWLLLLAVVAAIYSTLGLTGTLAAAVREKGLVEGTFVFCFILVLATIALSWIGHRPGRLEIWVGLGIAAVYLMVLVRMGIPEERTHLIEYGVVGIFIFAALKERASQGRHVPFPALIAVVATTLIGTIDECIQALLPNRVFDARDILFNFIAGILSVSASAALGWARQKRIASKT